MILVTPTNGYSNYLQKRDPDAAESREMHQEIFKSAKKVIEKDRGLSGFLEMLHTGIDNLSMIVKENEEQFYYLQYVEDASVSIVFDVDVSGVLEIIMLPESIKKIKNSAEKYTDIINTFLQKIKPSPTTESLIEYSKSNEIYFIDTERSKFLHIKSNIERMLEAIKQIDEELESIVYVREFGDFRVVTQSRVGVAPLCNIRSAAKDGFECIETDGLLVYTHDNRGKKYVIEIHHAQELRGEQKEALSIICNIAFTAILDMF